MLFNLHSSCEGYAEVAIAVSDYAFVGMTETKI